jgi:hypothetical protein
MTQTGSPVNVYFSTIDKPCFFARLSAHLATVAVRDSPSLAASASIPARCSRVTSTSIATLPAA